MSGLLQLCCQRPAGSCLRQLPWAACCGQQAGAAPAWAAAVRILPLEWRARTSTDSPALGPNPRARPQCIIGAQGRQGLEPGLPGSLRRRHLHVQRARAAGDAGGDGLDAADGVCGVGLLPRGAFVCMCALNAPWNLWRACGCVVSVQCEKVGEGSVSRRRAWGASQCTRGDVALWGERAPALTMLRAPRVLAPPARMLWKCAACARS